MTLRALRLVIVHHHFRPGGVRRVIELATPQLVAHWPEPVHSVILATGEAPDDAWLRDFRERLDGTTVEVCVWPSFGYAAELSPRGLIASDLRLGIHQLMGKIRHENSVIWAHNLGLGRNLYLARGLTKVCARRGIPLLIHHHDWWFENRWHHFSDLKDSTFRTLRAMADATLANSPNLTHLAINQGDASVLKRYFPGRSGWLPNPAEPAAKPSRARIDAARAWLWEQVHEEAPIWLLPGRLLRRKNIAEALLLTRWLRPEAWLVTTGSVSSFEEQPYAETLTAAAQTHGWRLHLSVLRGDESHKPKVAELSAASEVLLLTSLQEGFGLPFVEAAALRRPLIARELPGIAPDLSKFGLEFPQSYREVLVAPTLFDWRGERARQQHLFAQWKALMPRAAAKMVGKPSVLAAGQDPRPVPFSRLTLTAQLEVLGQPIQHSWDQCCSLNPWLRRLRQLAGEGRLKASPWPRTAARWLGGSAYARRFLKCVPQVKENTSRSQVGQVALMDFLRGKLSRDNLYPLLWNSRT